MKDYSKNNFCLIEKSSTKCVFKKDTHSLFLLHFILSLSAFASVRLGGGSRTCTGIIEIRNRLTQEWSPVKWQDDRTSEWTEKISSIVCSQLGCGPALSTERSYVPLRKGKLQSNDSNPTDIQQIEWFIIDTNMK